MIPRLFIYAIAIQILLSHAATAQDSPTSSKVKKEKPTISTQTEKNFKESFLDATDLAAYGFYADALTAFVKMAAADPSNANVNFYAGSCIINAGLQPTKAIDYLKKAVANTSPDYTYTYKERAAPEVALLFLGKMYHLNGQYDEALSYFEKYKATINTKSKDLPLAKEVNHCIEMTNNAKIFIAQPTKVKILPFAAVNSISDDYAPVMAVDEKNMYFSSKRKGAMGGLKDKNGKFFDDIYATVFKAGKWSKPIKMQAKINTFDYDVVNSISANGTQLFFSRNKDENFDIYVSLLSPKKKWQAPSKLSVEVNSKYNEQWAFLSPDGNSLFFSSDKPGGFGGYDIYKCNKTASGSWSAAVNLGQNINTAYDDICPVLLANGAFYFSSQGHNSMGGFDVFKSGTTDGITWTAAENMGYPLNTPFDDYSFMPSAEGKKGYYATAKKGGFSEMDIFQFSFE